MASPELHIKDCYYFEVPKLLWPSARKSIADFPAVWIKNDSQFQDWEADRLCERLAGMGTKDLPPADKLKDEYQQWKHHGHENFGKPMSAFLMEKREDLRGRFSAWQRTAGKDGGCGRLLRSG